MNIEPSPINLSHCATSRYFAVLAVQLRADEIAERFSGEYVGLQSVIDTLQHYRQLLRTDLALTEAALHRMLDAADAMADARH